MSFTINLTLKNTFKRKSIKTQLQVRIHYRSKNNYTQEHSMLFTSVVGRLCTCVHFKGYVSSFCTLGHDFNVFKTHAQTCQNQFYISRITFASHKGEFIHALNYTYAYALVILFHI